MCIPIASYVQIVWTILVASFVCIAWTSMVVSYICISPTMLVSFGWTPLNVVCCYKKPTNLHERNVHYKYVHILVHI
jgi:hypothetical protein